MEQRGYLEGTHLSSAFNLLQSADLLYWNSDSTRMPRRMQSYYLRNMYLENRLAEPGSISLAGEAIDLGKVRIPAFFLATEKDHIAPWQSCYRGANQVAGSSRLSRRHPAPMSGCGSTTRVRPAGEGPVDLAREAIGLEDVEKAQLGRGEAGMGDRLSGVRAP